MTKFEVTAGLTELDDATCKKVASLIAYGFTERQVADALLLTDEQVAAAQRVPIYLQALAEFTHARAQRAIDLADGWDAVEEKAVANVLQTLEHNRDPRYSLLAARTANQARRRQIDTSAGKTIDAGKAGNVIVLSLSKTFVERRQVTQASATLTLTDQNAKEMPKKINDTALPGKITELLGDNNSRSKGRKMMDDIFGDIFDELGVAPEMIENG